MDRRTDADSDQRDADRQTAGLAALAVVLGLVVLGLFLVQILRANMRMEDCLMAGRINCDPAAFKGR